MTAGSLAMWSNGAGWDFYTSVLDQVMMAPIQLQCIFPIPFWPILYWNHMHLIHINQNWCPVILLIGTNVRDPHLGHE